MAATFAFIDHAFIDRKESRRNIRLNVMKCKESGKMRSSSPSRLRLLRSKKTSQAAAVTTKAVPVHASHPSKQQPLMDGQYGAQPQIFDEKPALPEQPKVCPKLNVHVGNGLSGLSSACEMNAQTRRIVHDFLCYVGDSLHPAKDCKNKPDPNMTIWFQYMLVDEAYFHCFVALSEACLDFAHGKEAYSSEYRHHICMALKLINDKLSSDKAVADTNLAGVIALCLLSSLREQPVQTKIHFDGLCKMIEVRGGMQELAGNPALVEKALRIDIDLALQLGCATRLGRSAKTLDAIVPIFSNPAFEVRSPLINAVRNADQEVLIASEDIMKVSRLFNSGVAAKKLGPHAFQDIITTTCYQLLDIRPIEGKRCDMHPVANAIHLALLAFMTTFLIQFGRQRRLRYELISRKLMKALDNPKFQAAVDPATHLWLLVMTGISVLGKEHRVWLKPRLSDAIAAFGVDDWKFAKRLLSKYPWIGDLHDEPAAKLWQLCFPANDDGH